MTICSAVEFFSSIAHMEDLLHDEEEIISDVDEYITLEEIRIAKLRAKLENIKTAKVCKFLMKICPPSCTVILGTINKLGIFASSGKSIFADPKV